MRICKLRSYTLYRTIDPSFWYPTATFIYTHTSLVLFIFTRFVIIIQPYKQHKLERTQKRRRNSRTRSPWERRAGKWWTSRLALSHTTCREQALPPSRQNRIFPIRWSSHSHMWCYKSQVPHQIHPQFSWGSPQTPQPHKGSGTRNQQFNHPPKKRYRQCSKNHADV